MADRDDELAALRAEIARLREENGGLAARAEAAEAKLRTARAIHDVAIESLPFDFWARDRDGYCISQNATARAHWGNVVDTRPEDMALPADVLALWLDNNRRALAGEIVHGDHSYVLGGVERFVHNILAPIRMGDEIVGTLGVNIDLTEQRRAETERASAIEALRESEEKLRMAADATGIGFWSWDVRRDELKWEAPLFVIFGLPPGAPPKGRQGYLALVHPEDRARAVETLTRGVQDGAWDDEYRVVRSDGAVRWVFVKGKVVRREGGDVIVGAVMDVTERRARDEASRQAQKLEAVGQLTSGIAHNFNNMLMGVLPNLALAERTAPPAIVPLLEGARRSAERAADLVRQLMTYAGRNRPSERRVAAIAPIVRRAVELCRTTFDKRIAIEASYDEGARARVDEAQLEQAVLNILINARDAVAEVDSPRVSVAVEIVRAGAPELGGRADHVRVRIVDNGAGMDTATRARVFEPFFTTKEVGKGTGLGLPTTQAIAREHDGWIGCESAPREGAAFCLYLPRAIEAEDAVRPPVERAAARGSETVLVIDDEPSIRRVLAMMLGGAGYTAKLAGSGQEAIDLLADPRIASQVALVLLDVSMPGMPRQELRRRLRTIVPQARVVYFTGYAFDAADADDAVLEKPVTEARLLATIRDVLDHGAPREG